MAYAMITHGKHSPSNPSSPSSPRNTREPRTPVFKGEPPDEKAKRVEAVVNHIGIILDHALRDARQNRGLSNSDLVEILKPFVNDALTVSRICSDTNSDERHVNLQILAAAYYAGLIDIHATLDKALEDVANPDVRQQWEEIDARYHAVRKYKNQQKKKKGEKEDKISQIAESGNDISASLCYAGFRGEGETPPPNLGSVKCSPRPATMRRAHQEQNQKNRIHKKNESNGGTKK